MAEFQEVIRQWGRMCKCNTCGNEEDLPMCPIDCSLGLALCDELPHNWTEEAAEQFEAIVIKWAEEHPEPVYPTFAEWLYVSFLKWCQANHPRRAKDEKAWFDYLYETHIPANIAQKLGIKPVEGGKG